MITKLLRYGHYKGLHSRQLTGGIATFYDRASLSAECDADALAQGVRYFCHPVGVRYKVLNFGR